jgi:hypothetical protein
MEPGLLYILFPLLQTYSVEPRTSVERDCVHTFAYHSRCLFTNLTKDMGGELNQYTVCFGCLLLYALQYVFTYELSYSRYVVGRRCVALTFISSQPAFHACKTKTARSSIKSHLRGKHVITRRTIPTVIVLSPKLVYLPNDGRCDALISAHIVQLGQTVRSLPQTITFKSSRYLE